MRTIKALVIVLFPMFLLYLLNILIFNNYPMFIGCFCGSGIYSKSLLEITSYRKVIDNLFEKEKKKLYTEDFINLVLIFILTVLLTFLIYLLFEKGDLGLPFWGTSYVFLIMGHFKFPKRFYS